MLSEVHTEAVDEVYRLNGVEYATHATGRGYGKQNGPHKRAGT